MNTVIIKCPVCGDHPAGAGFHKHCYIYLDRGRYNCYFCDSRGSLRWLARKYPQIQDEIGFQELEESIKNALDERREPSVYRFAPLSQGPWSVSRTTVLKYLERRGMNAKDIIRCNVMTSEMLPLAAIFPHSAGTDTFWAARFVAGKYKWKFPKAGSTLRTKSEVVWGLERVQAMREESIWICEGIFDALAVNGVCCFGKSPSPMQIQTILKIKPKELVLALDQDAAENAHELQKKLRAIIKTRVCLPEKFPDYGNYLEHGLRRLFHSEEFVKVGD